MKNKYLFQIKWGCFHSGEHVSLLNLGFASVVVKEARHDPTMTQIARENARTVLLVLSPYGHTWCFLLTSYVLPEIGVHNHTMELANLMNKSKRYREELCNYNASNNENIPWRGDWHTNVLPWGVVLLLTNFYGELACYNNNYIGALNFFCPYK